MTLRELTWSPWTVVAHLNHCERTDWMPRLEIILKDGPSRTFDPFDMKAHFTESAGKSISTLLEEFTTLRQTNLSRLNSLDLTHIKQICRTLARQNQQAVGPWAAYLSILP